MIRLLVESCRLLVDSSLCGNRQLTTDNFQYSNYKKGRRVPHNGTAPACISNRYFVMRMAVAKPNSKPPLMNAKR